MWEFLGFGTHAEDSWPLFPLTGAGNRHPMPESARDWCLVSLSGRRASAQVWHPAQAQAISDFSKPLPAGRDEAAEQTALAQFLQPRA